jgi:phosphohistidine phosphatase
VDPARALSDRGKVEIGRLAGFVKRLGLYPREVWHSGKARAEETARILLEGLAGEVPLIQRPGLNPNDSPLEAAGQVEAFGADLMLVGHLPFMSLLSSHLLARGGPPEVLTFRTGSMACLRTDGGESWHLEWLVHPNVLTAV